MTYPPSSPAEPPEEAPVSSPTVPNPIYQPGSPPPAYQPGVARPTYPPTASYPTYDPNAGYPGYAPPPPRRRSGLVVGLVIATVLVICAGLGVAGAILFLNVAKDVVASGDTPNPQPAGPGSTSGPADENPTDGQNEGDGGIVIEVSGDGPVAIFYGAGGGKNENLRDVDLPWRITLPREGQTQVITVLASRVALTDGEVTCRILLDGTELQKQTKDGKIAIATCVTVL
jgi:hypothetical protein